MRVEKLLAVLVFVLSVTTVAVAQDEYFVHHDSAARALSQQLQANARESPLRFDNSDDISKLPAWFVGSCPTAASEFHLIAYYSTPALAYIGVFRSDKQLHALWKFTSDARQFYTEGTRLMFAVRPMLQRDTHESWAAAPREIVVDFAALPASITFAFHEITYSVPE